MKLSRFPLLATLATVGVLGLLAAGLWLSFRPKPVLLEGEIEATEYDVAAKVPGRVESVAVKLGQAVARGALLFTLESPELRAKLAQAEGARESNAFAFLKQDDGYQAQTRRNVQDYTNPPKPVVNRIKHPRRLPLGPSVGALPVRAGLPGTALCHGLPD